ncbi:biotin transporter BioY [Thermodesulfobacterium sp. TA1]|uniref:biotin transporter BioY n=1 Tax=Thermodesulfobacterium sp. TA1 TaxID=2234087 RepID=UPI00123224FB|nr:biotin transporter BioY [Thermodesulfobacterium sp. TA1]QER42137.1 biotin transporter BioY [Thermodesulfobacterium sp. TA1]
MKKFAEVMVLRKGVLTSGNLGIEVFWGLLGALLIGLSAQLKFYLPFSPVPVTFQTFGVFLTALLFSPFRCGLAQFFYLFLGALGLPWFAGATGGFLTLVGPTGGYLLSFLPAGLMVSFLYHRFIWTKSFLGLVFLLVIVNFGVIHLMGMLWLGWILKISDIKVLLLMGSLPFIYGDLLKIFLVVFTLKYILRKF